ncbi:MAG TPA: hypothetical protein VF796_11525 [Humisphaera sp.]
MWTAEEQSLPDRPGRRYAIRADGRPLAFADALRLLGGDPAFRTYLSALLAAAPYRAFKWETPAVTVATLARPFEFVVLEAPGLPSAGDPSDFAEHFAALKAPAGVATFTNLGGDATLVSPAPAADRSAYGHLAAFVRGAPDAQKHALWQAVAAAMTRRVGVRPVWLSTAGMGVPWLHVRLDDRPKYYGHAAYRNAEWRG